MVVVSNSSPIIHLTKIDQLHLLEKLFGQIIIAEKVFHECTVSKRYRDEVKIIINQSWINKKNIHDVRLYKLLHSEIDAGEAEALILALETEADLVLLDDQEARIKARKLELPVTGTIGVLLKAKNRGMIESFKDSIQKLQTSGFRISQDFFDNLISQYS